MEISPKSTCSEEGCDRPVYARGLCRRDYAQHRHTGALLKSQPRCPVDNCSEAIYFRGPCRAHRDEFDAAGMSWCTAPNCQNPLKSLDEFTSRPNKRNGVDSWCNPCCADRQLKYHHGKQSANPGFRHGLTDGQYRSMRTEQGGECAVCSAMFDPGPDSKTVRMCIDHDHTHCPGDAGCPECVRSLLCYGCNNMLGRCHDDPTVLRRWKPTKAFPQWRIDAAITYLEKWHAEMAKRGIRPSPEDALWQDVFGALGRLITEMA